MMAGMPGTAGQNSATGPMMNVPRPGMMLRSKQHTMMDPRGQHPGQQVPPGFYPRMPGQSGQIVFSMPQQRGTFTPGTQMPPASGQMHPGMMAEAGLQAPGRHMAPGGMQHFGMGNRAVGPHPNTSQAGAGGPHMTHPPHLPPGQIMPGMHQVPGQHGHFVQRSPPGTVQPRMMTGMTNQAAVGQPGVSVPSRMVPPGVTQTPGLQGLKMATQRKVSLLDEQPLLLEDLLEQVCVTVF